ncbi:hypothetical protein ES702_01723 [subsurface metagenome]
MLTKTWSTKSDFEAGTLNNVLVPEGTNRLELKRKALSGTATYIVFGAQDWNHPHNRVMNWQGFEYSKENTKTILRDDFRENSLGEYYQEGVDSAYPGFTAPTYDSANKRVNFDTGDNKGFTLRPKNLSVQNFIMAFDFLGQVIYPQVFLIHAIGRWVNQSNMYSALVSRPIHGWYGSPAIYKLVNGVSTSLVGGVTPFSLNTKYQMITTINGNSLKVEIPDLAFKSTTDSQFPNAGAVKFGAFQGKGWLDNFLLEHYSLPSPPNCSVSFKFWPSKDGVNFGSEYTDIKLVPNALYIKVQATLSRNSLASAMPVLNSMTLTYKLLVQPVFF